MIMTAHSLKSYEPNPWSWTRFNLVYSAVGCVGAIQIHFCVYKGNNIFPIKQIIRKFSSQY